MPEHPTDAQFSFTFVFKQALITFIYNIHSTFTDNQHRVMRFLIVEFSLISLNSLHSLNSLRSLVSLISGSSLIALRTPVASAAVPQVRMASAHSAVSA